MNTQQATQTLAGYSYQQKTAFLAWLAHEVTVLARDTYEAGQEGLVEPRRLRALNEVQHRVTGSLLALLRNDPARYPDDVLIRLVLEHPEDAGLERQLRHTFDRLAGLVSAAA